MHRYVLTNLLLDETSGGKGATQFTSPPVNRRHFLIGSGAAYLASVTPALADGLLIEKVGRGFRLTLQSNTWLVDPEKFGPASTAEYRWVDATGRYRSGVPTSADDPTLIAHEIELKNAVFPGFSLRADFKAQLYSRAGEWYLRIGFAEANWKQIEIAFAGWIDPDANTRTNYRSAYRGAAIVVGNVNNRENKIDPEGRPAQFEIAANFAARIAMEPNRGALRFASKRFRFGATGIRLFLDNRAGVPLPNHAIGPHASLAFEDARFRHGKADLGPIGRTLKAHIDYDHCEAVMVGFHLSGTRPALADALLRLNGDGALVLSGPGTGPIGTRLQLEHWRVVARANGLDHDAKLAGWVARFAHAIEGDRVSIVVQGDGYSTTRQDIELDIGSKASERIAFNSHLLAAHVPILGASTADLDFRRSIVRIVLGKPERDNIAPDSVPRDARYQIADGRAYFKTVLDNADLRVKRSTDLLDLSFGFKRYELSVEDGVALLFRRPQLATASNPRARAKPPLPVDPDQPLLIVKFHPQYLLEQAFAEDGGSGCAAKLPKEQDRPPNSICYTEPGRDNLRDIRPPGLAQTRLSGPSRIVFSETDKTNRSPKGDRLSVSYLTEWSHLATVVNKRALPRDATLADQLDLVGINRLTSRTDAKEMIIANTEPPGPEETAIEPVYRMIISPDAKARWTTPRRLPTPAAPSMWSAELANPKSTAVRVLWSRDMDLSFLEAGVDKLDVPERQFKSDPVFAASVNREDRRQLAQMMSVYGIAALRRITLSGSDDPNGMVFLPQENYCALDPKEEDSVDSPPITARQEGFVLARPFDDSFRLQLARAATMDARWIGEPPAPHPSKRPDKYQQFFKPAFTIEKYIHQTQDGRDTFVEVTYKGFLFPIGHRAALLKVTKREFWPEKRDPNGAPIAYLIQRRYIVVRKPEKAFPAYAQPYASRDFPAKKVTIKTIRTPDLADPEPIAALGRLPTDVCRPLDAGGSVFWPQLAASTSADRLDALFEYTIDDGPVVRSPLLFIDNAVVHDAPSMKVVTEYYNALPQQNLLTGDADKNKDCFLRVAKLFETPRRYADEINKGECSFKSAAWVLGARGRLSTSVITVTNAEKAPDSALIRLTVSSLSAGFTDLRTKTKYRVAGVLGTDEANDVFEFKKVVVKVVNGVEVVDDKHVDLVGSTFSKKYISGGTIGEVGDDFTMDAFMEGRDQPPFYPIMTKGRITVDKVDRLTGAPNTAIEVTFDPTYVKNGFDPTNNPSEIFLDVLRPDIQFDPAGNTSQTGGVATTNSLLAGLARRSGLIGGTGAAPLALPSCQPRTDGPPACAPATPAPMAGPAAAVVVAPPLAPAAATNPAPAGSQPVSPYNMASALAGRFDPIEFFGGALKDAKLLGIVPLKDILRAVLIAAAPKLVETAQYGAAKATEAIEETLKAIIKVAKPAAETVVESINKIEREADAKLKDVGTPQMSLSALYPKFTLALDQTRITAAKIAALEDTDAKAENADKLFGLASAFKSDVETVITELRRLASDPMPTIVREQLALLQEQWKQLRNFADNPKETIEKLLKTVFDPGTLFDQLCGQFDPDTFQLVFGVLDDPASAFTAFPEPAQRTPPTAEQVRAQCVRLVKNPAAVLPRLQQALFYEVFAEPFSRLLAGVQQLQQQATGSVAWGRAVVADRIAAVLRRGIGEAQAQGLPDYACQILADMETAIPLIVVNEPLDQIGPKLEAAAKQSLDSQIKKLQHDIKLWREKAKKDVDLALKDVKERALKQIDEATEAEYQKAFAYWASKKKLADAYAKLAAKYGLKIVKIDTDNETITVEIAPPDELKNIVNEIRKVAEEEIRSAVAELEAKLREQAKAAAEGLAQRVFAFANGVIDTALRSAFAVSVANAGKSLTDLCGAAAKDAYAFVNNLAVGLTDKIDAKQITDLLTNINNQLGQLQIPANAPQDARDVILGLHASLTRSLQQFAGAVLEFEKIRKKLQDPDTGPKKPGEPKLDAVGYFCQKPKELLDLTARSVDLRRRSAQAIVDALSHVETAVDVLPRLVNATPPAPPAPAGASVVLKSVPATATDLDASLKALADALGKMVLQITVVGSVANNASSWSSVNAKVTDLKNAAASAKEAVAGVEAALKPFTDLTDPNSPIRLQIKASYQPHEALKLAQDVLQFTVLNDRRLAGVVLQAAQPLLKLWTDILAKTAKSLGEVAKALNVINGTVETTLTAVVGLFQPGAGGAPSLLSNIVSRDTRAALENALARVTADKNSLDAIVKLCAATPLDAQTIAKALTELKGNWAKNQPGLIQTLQVARNIVDAVASGHFAALFDLAELEHQLIEAVAGLIPTRVTLNYDFDTEVGDFPSSDPIFAMDKEKYGSYGPDPARNDLDLRTQITVDLLSGNRQVSAVGYIKPFRIHLLGNSLDLATVHFKGARFETTPGGDTKFTADIGEAEIGSMLSFLQALQSFMSPSGGNGFYRGIQLIPPQIEVGYRFNKDVLIVGGLIFQNIGFGIGAILPLDGRQAEFRFNFASREKPFFISAPPPTPYGGGGFVGLRANARGVVAFEIQLQFGAAFAIEFGPLLAFVRISAGIYLLSEAGGRRILEGFVEAVGEGNIACFSVSVLIQIKTSQQSDSSMAGSSTYAFSFKVGFFEVTYSVTAGYRTKGSGGSAQAQILPQDTADAYGQTALPPARRGRKSRPAAVARRKVRTEVPAMQDNWKEYRKNFDI
ncbi:MULTISPECIES: hypothetical protein [unclassified Bradyrhizobium]|uniref:hypothetical protein n=1 Tax=unclassified Bradyrhizobium TaxID=2631580 RepID=UPI0028E2AF33|nr:MULTISPECIES: hypothetical protein [unclassified Bradyrhizobium]